MPSGGSGAIALTGLFAAARAAGGRQPASPSGQLVHPAGAARRQIRSFCPRGAKQVLMIFCSGACSHLDTWDYKPELIKRDGQPMPGFEKLVTFQGPSGNLTISPYEFRPRGECGKIHLATCCRNWANRSTRCASSIR